MMIESNTVPRLRGGWADLPAVPAGESAGWPDELRCVARHMAVAASQLVREGAIPTNEVARFAAAEALLRTQADDTCSATGRPATPWPGVRVTPGVLVPLILLGASVLDHRSKDWRRTGRSIDTELVYEARELLCGLRWYLPSDPEVIGEEIAWCTWDRGLDEV